MFTCISCRVAFDNADEQRAHFSTDWHRYNMKRRIANLPPVAAAAFNVKVIERREQNAIKIDPRDFACSTCKKTFNSENAYTTHFQSKKHRDRANTHNALRSVDPPQSQQESQKLSGSSEGYRPNSMSIDDAGDEGDLDIDQTLAAARSRRYLPSDCLFCPLRSNTIDISLAHMGRAHSFFIPDKDHLIDLAGLLSYLGEKVVIGNICLFCPDGGREFSSVGAVRNHMIDKGHCKIALESDADWAELMDFYSYDTETLDDDWEDVDQEWHEVDQNGEARRQKPHLPTLMNDGLSLHLPSGRIIGHRSLRVYYEQNFRGNQFDRSKSRSFKLASIKHSLADPTQALISAAGGAGAYGKGLVTFKAQNAGEARWARKQARSYLDQRKRDSHTTLVGFRGNNQRHFRDPLLQ